MRVPTFLGTAWVSVEVEHIIELSNCCSWLSRLISCPWNLHLPHLFLQLCMDYA